MWPVGVEYYKARVSATAWIRREGKKNVLFHYIEKWDRASRLATVARPAKGSCSYQEKIPLIKNFVHLDRLRAIWMIDKM